MTTWDMDGAGPTAEVLVVGGAFRSAGTLPVSGLAIWDGEEWSTLGPGLTSPIEAEVRDLSTINGELVVYEFARQGAGGEHRISRWTGTVFESLGRFAAPSAGAAGAMTVFEGDLVVAGEFTSINGQAANIIRWNGSEWSRLGSVQPSGLAALAVHEGRLYAGGYGVSRWNGETWEYVGSGPWAGRVHELSVVDGELYAAGTLSRASGVPVQGLAQWDGSTWTNPYPSLTSQTGDFVSSVRRYQGEFYAAGRFRLATGNVVNFARWTGNGWVALGLGVPYDPVYSLTTFQGRLVAAGSFRFAGEATVANIAAWDGRAWSALGEGTSGVVYAMAVFGDRLVVGGAFLSMGGVAARNIAVWDGLHWRAMGAGFDRPVHSLAVSGEILYAGGEFTASGEREVSRLAKWDGNSWTSVAPGIANPPIQIWAVRYIAPRDGCIYISGYRFNFSSARPEYSISVWDGTVWSPALTGGHGGAELIGEFGGRLVAGGPCTNSVCPVLIMEGASWRSLGQGTTGSPRASVDLNGELIVAGTFGSVDNVPSYGVAAWNGASWRDLSQLVGIYPIAAGVHRGNLLAAGYPRTDGHRPISSVLQLRGSRWLGIDQGLDGAVYAIASFQGDLFIGGDFTRVGDVVSPSIGRWTARPDCPADFSCDATLGVQDVLNFITAFLSADARADFNGRDGVTVQDLFDYLTAFFAGCS